MKSFFPRKFPFSRFEVSDSSMEPFLHHGDHVLTFNWIIPEISDVVVFRFFASVYTESKRSAQNDKGIYYIKRVKRLSGSSVFVQGDNKTLSSTMGPIRKKQIVGKVILKY